MAFASDLDQHVTALTAQLRTVLADGFDLSDVVGVLVTGVMAFTQIAQQYSEIPDAKKQRVITQALRRVYMSQKIDLPLIPEPFETMLENLLFSVLVPELYKVFVTVAVREGGLSPRGAL